jgi:hypothetical protein
MNYKNITEYGKYNIFSSTIHLFMAEQQQVMLYFLQETYFLSQLEPILLNHNSCSISAFIFYNLILLYIIKIHCQPDHIPREMKKNKWFFMYIKDKIGSAKCFLTLLQRSCYL